MDTSKKIYTLKPGMRFIIGGLTYKVRTVRKSGKCVIQYIGIAASYPHVREIKNKQSFFSKIKGIFKK